MEIKLTAEALFESAKEYALKTFDVTEEELLWSDHPTTNIAQCKTALCWILNKRHAYPKSYLAKKLNRNHSSIGSLINHSFEKYRYTSYFTNNFNIIDNNLKALTSKKIKGSEINQLISEIQSKLNRLSILTEIKEKTT